MTARLPACKRLALEQVCLALSAVEQVSADAGRVGLGLGIGASLLARRLLAWEPAQAGRAAGRNALAGPNWLGNL